MTAVPAVLLMSTAVAAGGFVPPSPLAGADLTGRWTLSLDPGFGDSPATLQCDIAQESVAQKGLALTLECDDLPAIAGTLDDHAVKFVVMTGQDNLLPARFSGTLEANETVISGTWRLEDTTGNRIGRFSADKQPRTP